MSTKATTYESLDNKIAASTLTEDLVKGLEVVDGHAIKEKKDYEKPDELYDMLIARIRQYHPSTDISMIEKAYELAKKAHGNQCRKSGEPYIVHPLWVTIILANLEMDKETIVAGMLHDVVEDTEVTDGEIEKEFGKEKAEKIAASFLEDKPTWVRCNLHRADRESILASLKAQGTSVRELPFMESMIAIDGYDYLEGLDAFRKGWIQVQDVTSAFVGEIASPEKDSYIIDVCAAPGGKSLHLADKLEGTGMVEARDLTYQKTALIEENMARCGVTNMKTLVWDALETDLSAMAKADIVIADLPCSGLGIIGRKPDIKYNMTPEKLEELAGLQREILSVVWQYVKPGGLLCYSTCTIDRLENQDNAAWLRDRFPLVPVDLTDRFGGLPQEPSLKDGWIQFLPGVHPYDGFFISVFRRAEDETGPEGI